MTVPANTDAVGCSPLFEIRESQNPTQFGPAHLSPINKMNVETQNTGYVPLHACPGVAGRGNTFGIGDGTEMDLSPDASADQPSPATSNSRTQSQSGGGSTSHSSYSPGDLAYRPSPRMSNQVPLPHTSTPSANTNANFYTTGSDDMFNANMYNNPGIDTDSIANSYMLGNEWELGSMGVTTGMTPMSDGGWNQMLDSINLGWDAVGPPHGQNPPGR
jgi:hypothetical protein